MRIESIESDGQRKGATYGLVLTGGGARGAYQAGVLRAISEICDSQKACFSVISGVSAGAINAAYCASRVHDFKQGMVDLCDLWKNIVPQDVYRADLVSLAQIGFRWISDLSLGGLYRKKLAHSLLDTEPLREFLSIHIDFGLIAENLSEGLFQSLTCSSFSYGRGHTVTFVQARDTFEPWVRPRRRSQAEVIGVNHLMASSAVPLIFPSVPMNGDFFGDGALRNTAPIGPAINLGATKLLVIGVRYPQPTDVAVTGLEGASPSVSHIAGHMLNSLFFDLTDVDLERVSHVNEIVARLPRGAADQIGLVQVEYLRLRPSRSLSDIAAGLSDRFPKSIQYLLGGLGGRQENSNLASYLLFDGFFTSALVDLGYQDGLRARKEIEEFFQL